MKKLLSLLIIATIITSSLCVSYFAIDDNSTQNNTESTTVPVTETSSTVTTEPVTESSTVESSTVPTTTKPVVKVKSIKLNKSIVNLAKKGNTCTLKATVYPNNAYDKSVNWTSNNKKVATVDKNGKIKAIINKGITYVNAIAKDGSKIRTRVLVVVGEKVKKITLNKTSVTLNRGAKNRTFQLKKAIKNKNATYKGVSWYSSNKNIATVNSTGKVTIKRRGKVVITVKARDGSNKSAKCKVTVRQLVTKLSYNKKTQKTSVNVGKTIKFNVVVSPSNANNKGLVFSTSNKKVATVNSKGIIKGLKSGKVVITVKARDGSNKSAKCKITVKQLVTKLSYNGKKQAKEVYKNKTIKFAVTVAPSNANNKGLSYSSSNKKVATVNSKGIIKGIKAGTVTITAKAKDGSRKAVKLTVKVKNPPISDNTKLTIKQLKSKSIVKRHCDMLNNYFKSCGATIEPRLKGQHQWYVEDTSGYCVDNFVSLNYWYTETLSYWIQEMSGDFLNNDIDWNNKGYLKDSNKYADFLSSFIYLDKNGYPQYRKNLILDSKYNGFDWLINTYTKKLINF